jgi:hypothetical protein
VRRLFAGLALAAALLFAVPASAAPYVSCPGGYIAPTLKDCPVWPPRNRPNPPGTGGGGAGGVLGDLLGSLGLGGLL